MKRESAFLMVFLIILVVSLSAALGVQRVEASGTIYIKADGSIDPIGAPLSTVDSVTYTFAGNINYSIVVERNNIVVEGAGYTVTGSGSGNGITLTNSSNVTVRNMTIENFDYGIALDYSSNNTLSDNNVTANGADGISLSSSSSNILSSNNATDNGLGIVVDSSSDNTLSGNKVTANGDGISLRSSSNNNVLSSNNVTANSRDGILLYWSSNNSLSGNNVTANNGVGILLSDSLDNVLSGNNVTNNGEGVELDSSSGNSICHNNFINNTQQALIGEGITNTWNESYPSGGNYWSDYNGTDTNHDGIGGTPYIIDANNTDHYPLMVPYIIPEFPSFLIMPLFFIATLLAVITYKRKYR